jgi:transcription factor E
MQINLLKNMVEEMTAPGSGLIVDILFEKRDVNEFLIAKKMDLTINQVRNILYKLSAEGLVSFTRKKDKKKGWYIYFWTLNITKCLTKIEAELTKKEEELKKSLNDRELGRYYICKGCNLEVTEEKALENDFSCEECAEVYTSVDNTNMIRDIKGKITKKENEIKDIKLELEITKEKEEKRRQKEKPAVKSKKKVPNKKTTKKEKPSTKQTKPKKKKKK